MISPADRFTRQERIAWQIIEGEAVLIDREEGEVLRLNPIGTAIWTAMDGTRSVSEITDHLHRTFEVDRARAEKDVVGFLRELMQRELVKDPIAQGAGASR